VRKRPAYQRNRVLSAGSSTIAHKSLSVGVRTTTDLEIVSEHLEWRPEGASEPFVLDLPKFFAELLPDDD
jgi:hypothetical protein